VSSALTTAPSAFACLEEDGLLLAVALAAALAMLALASVAAWEALSATGWVPGIL
jgi:Tfp pilus assembly protein FimT